MLRVHSIPGILDFYDYSPAASGMTYSNNHNPAGMPIDGASDQPVVSPLEWELVSGSQGSLVSVFTTTSDIENLAPTSYYLDSTSPSTTQCTGDAFAFGASGAWVNQGIPCTDPLPQALGGARAQTAIARSTPPASSTMLRRASPPPRPRRAAELAQPLQRSIQPWQPSSEVPTVTPEVADGHAGPRGSGADLSLADPNVMRKRKKA